MKHLIFSIFAIILFLSCANKSENDEIVTVFKNHSFSAVKPEKIEEIISQKGINGLKEIDPNCGFVSPKKPSKLAFKKGSTFPGFFIQNIDGKFLVRKLFESSYAWDVEGLSENTIILSVNGEELSPGKKSLDNFIAKSGEVLKIGFKNGKHLKQVPIKTSYPYFSIVWGFYIPELESAYFRFAALPKGFSKIVLSENERILLRGDFNSMIIDLRSAFSGDLEGLVETLSMFADRDEFLFETISDKKGYEKKFYSKLDGKFKDKKVVLIVDTKTAGFPALFAAVLKNLRKAIIVGEGYSGNLNFVRTFKLKNGKYFSVTVALVRTGNQIIERVIPDFSENCSYEGPAFMSIPYPVLDRDSCYMKAYSLLKK